MFVVKIDSDIITETPDEVTAWATYWSAARRGDLRANRSRVTLLEGDAIRASNIAGEHFERPQIVTLNAILKTFMARWRYTSDDIRGACRSAGYPVSNSKVKGWLLRENADNFQELTAEELYLIINYINSHDD